MRSQPTRAVAQPATPVPRSVRRRSHNRGAAKRCAHVDVTTSSPEFGEAREPITVDYSGPALTICFNAQYVLDFLNVVDAEIVALDVKDDVSQAVLSPVNAEGYSYTYVIMPMRV